MITNPNGDVLFSDKELGCQHCGKQVFAKGFETELGVLRAVYGHPMKATSVCRCQDHNNAVGGHYNSLHLTDGGRGKGCCALDIEMIDGTKRAKLVGIALSRGWSVGIASNFLHLDTRTAVHGLEQRIFHYAR